MEHTEIKNADDIEVIANNENTLPPDISNELRLSVEPKYHNDDSERSLLQRRKNPKNMNRIGNLAVKDHFNLSHPSSTVKFVEKEAILFVDNFEQVIMEKKEGEDYITAKQVSITSPGLIGTRLAYTVVAFLMAGIVFVFCVQIIFFLFLGLVIDTGETNYSFIIDVMVYIEYSLCLEHFCYENMKTI